MLCRRSIVLLMMLVCWAGSTAAASPRETMGAVSIRIYDYAQIDGRQLQRAERRVSAIYEQIGVQIDWRAAREPSEIEGGRGQWPHDPPAHVTVVWTASAMGRRLNLQEDVAGYAPITREHGGRVAYVFGERTRAIAAEGAVDESEVLAGVIAHELAHLLMPKRSHSRDGVMRPQWTPAEFRSLNQERFSSSEADSIRQTVRAMGVTPRGWRTSHDGRIQADCGPRPDRRVRDTPPDDVRRAGVRDMVAALTERAWALQGGPADRPYLTRTMSQLAHVLRSHGWVEIACSTLEWTIEHGAVDGHVLSEVAECHLARGDVKGAEEILERARAAGLTTDAIYTSLVKAYGRAGQPERARRMFERAKADAAVTTFTYPALIAAYGAAGDLAGASRVFEVCSCRRPVERAGLHRTGQRLRWRGRHRRRRTAAPGGAAIGPHVCQARVRGHPCAPPQPPVRAARRLLDDAKREGLADVQCYQAIIAACHRAGRHREAKRVYACAASDPRLTGEDLKRVKGAYTRRGAAPAPAERSIAAESGSGRVSAC